MHNRYVHFAAARHTFWAKNSDLCIGRDRNTCRRTHTRECSAAKLCYELYSGKVTARGLRTLREISVIYEYANLNILKTKQFWFKKLNCEFTEPNAPTPWVYTQGRSMQNCTWASKFRVFKNLSFLLTILLTIFGWVGEAWILREVLVLFPYS